VRLDGGAEVLADVVRALDAEGLTVTDFQLHAPTLDDVFLARTGRKMETEEQSTDEQPVAAV
jgi:ABC-2 type transport system ATP-binding protein